MIDNSTIGIRIKACRQEQGMTLKSIEAVARVSATHISEIERGKTSPTVGALGRIADALGKNITYFLERETLPEVCHLPADQRGEPVQVGSARLWAMSHGVPGGRLAPFDVWLEAHHSLGPLGTGEANHIFMVQQGRLRFMVDGDEHTLEAGDSIHIGAGATYRALNEGPEAAQFCLYSSRRLNLA